jgi:predicted metal-binding protein
MKNTKSANRPPARKWSEYVSLALARGAVEAKIIPTRHVVTAEWVRLKCQFGCGGYNKRLCCPPHTPTPSETRRVLAEYQWALLYAYRSPGPNDLEYRRRMLKSLAGLERTVFLDGYYRAFALGSGPCRLCPACNLEGRCRHPEAGRPAMEACGIDVFATCRNAGIELEVVTRRDMKAKYVNLILIC